jgi:hypothetical protein
MRGTRAAPKARRCLCAPPNRALTMECRRSGFGRLPSDG